MPVNKLVEGSWQIKKWEMFQILPQICVGKVTCCFKGCSVSEGWKNNQTQNSKEGG